MKSSARIWPISDVMIPPGIDVSRCVICGSLTQGAGMILEVTTMSGSPTYRGICDRDTTNPGEISQAIRALRDPHFGRF